MKKEFLTLPNRVNDMLDNPDTCEILIGVLTYENHEKDIKICRDFSEIPEEDIEEVNYNKNHSRAERRRRTRNIGAKRITLAKKLYNEEKTSDERFVGRLKDGSEPLGWKHEYRFWTDADAEKWLNRKQTPVGKDNETAFNNFLDKESDSYEENDEIMAYNRLQEAEVAYAKAMQRRVDAAAEMKSAQFDENKAATEYYVAKYEYSKF